MIVWMVKMVNDGQMMVNDNYENNVGGALVALVVHDQTIILFLDAQASQAPSVRK